tara:strand:- start:68 stop:694 length:627 start_codon:yes stop_codon:yes gene_type:complete
MSKEMRRLLNESNTKRLYKHLMNYDCAVITAYRDSLQGCLKSSLGIDKEDSEFIELTKKENQSRNKVLLTALLRLKYGVTSVVGTYIENYMTDNEVPVSEHSFFVVNLTNDPKFKENLIKFGKYFCQDSVLFMDKGDVNNYLYGTNYSHPGVGNSEQLGKWKDGTSEYMTTKNKKSFYLETFDSGNVGSKFLIDRASKDILKRLDIKK